MCERLREQQQFFLSLVKTQLRISAMSKSSSLCKAVGSALYMMIDPKKYSSVMLSAMRIMQLHSEVILLHSKT